MAPSDRAERSCPRSGAACGGARPAVLVPPAPAPPTCPTTRGPLQPRHQPTSPRCPPGRAAGAPCESAARSARAPRALRRRPGLRSHRCARARPLAACRRLWTLAAGSRPPRPGAPCRRSTAGRRAGRQRGWVRPPLSRVGARAFLATLSVPRPSLAPRLVISLLCVSRHAAGPPSYERVRVSEF